MLGITLYLLDKEDGIRVAEYIKLGWANDIASIPIAKFITDNWKGNLLFNTCDHPTHAMYLYLTGKVLKCIDIPIAELPDLHPRAKDIGIYYKCLNHVLDFDPTATKSSLKGKHTEMDVARLYVAAYNENRKPLSSSQSA